MSVKQRASWVFCMGCDHIELWTPGTPKFCSKCNDHTLPVFWGGADIHRARHVRETVQATIKLLEESIKY